MVYCAALNCQNATSGAYKNSTVTFYGFPLENKPLLKQWIHNLGWDIGTPSKYQRLCSNHFEDSSFETDPLKTGKNRRLLKEAVPKKFILGEDGNWLVGTPQSFCGGISNKTRKRIRNPEHSRVKVKKHIQRQAYSKYKPGTPDRKYRHKVPGTFDSAAAREGKDLEDRQKALYKQVIKENYGSLTTLDCPVPKSNIQAREALHVKDQQDFEEREVPASLSAGCGGAAVRSQLQSHARSSENTDLHESFSGGSRDLTCQISHKGVTSENRQNSAADQENPRGSRRGNSSLEEGGANEFKGILFYQQTHAGERLYLCAECQKAFKLKIDLLKHKEIHTRKNQVSSYICTDCGKSFGRYAGVVRHQRTHAAERPYKCTECEKSFIEKSRLTNHLRTHNIYM